MYWKVFFSVRGEDHKWKDWNNGFNNIFFTQTAIILSATPTQELQVWDIKNII